MGCYAGIAVVLIILVFPETLNHAYLNATTEILGKVQNLIDMQKEVLDSPQDAFVAPSVLLAKITGVRMGVLQRFQQSKLISCCDIYYVLTEDSFCELQVSKLGVQLGKVEWR